MFERDRWVPLFPCCFYNACFVRLGWTLSGSQAAACSPAVSNTLGVVISLLSLYLCLRPPEGIPQPRENNSPSSSLLCGGNVHLASFVLLWPPMSSSCVLGLPAFFFLDQGFKKNGSPGTIPFPAQWCLQKSRGGESYGATNCHGASCSPASYTFLAIIIYSFIINRHALREWFRKSWGLPKSLPALLHLAVQGKDSFDRQEPEDIWCLCCGLRGWWKFSAVWFLSTNPFDKGPCAEFWGSLIHWQILKRAISPGLLPSKQW